jgi:hypothetical protein
MKIRGNRYPAILRRLLASISLAAFAHGASAFDFKGLVLGEPSTPAQVESVFAACAPFRGTQCSDTEQMLHESLKMKCGEGLPGATVCNGWTTIAGHRAKANIVIGPSGKLQRIWLTQIDSDYFDDVHEALVTKLGRPRAAERSRVQNAFGAQYQQVDYAWSDARGRRVVLQKYASRVDESSVMFSTPDDRAMHDQRSGTKGGL